MSTIIFQIQSTLIVMLLIFGVLKRKNRKLHIRTMLTAIIWDIFLVLQIELTRGAINKASQVTENPMLLNIHVSLAMTTVLLYFAMLFTGNKLKKGFESVRTQHMILGYTTFIIRMLTYITSFGAVS
jgi:uncharacterized membrane protein YozB (DUF420 family)